MTRPTAISKVHARRILDSRGRPTVEAEIVLASGARGRASVPSGASTGRAEAVELRDGGCAWGGLDVGAAVGHVKTEIAAALAGLDARDQEGVDRAMRQLDGTGDLGRLGANAVLATSLATLRASAAALSQPLHRRVADLAGTEPALPLPMVNILSGGLHARGAMDIQDVLVLPLGATSFSQALEWVCRIRTVAAERLAARGITTLLADEGGLSPGFARTEEALAFMMEVLDEARLAAGRETALALDLASSSLRGKDGRYRFPAAGDSLDAIEMIALQKQWATAFPIAAIEDGLGEEDWDSWPALTRALHGVDIIGDDLLATQPERIRRAVGAGACNAALIKLNQNGTVSGTLSAIAEARRGGWSVIVSARSGETEDELLADFAVGVAADRIKIGSVRSSERMAKYNQLLRLEEQNISWQPVLS